MSWYDDIRRMHEHYGHSADGMDGPTVARLLKFRMDFIGEEYDELRSAVTPDDVVDALIDLCVVAIGTLHMMGVDGQRAWEEVLRANMSKAAGVNSSRPNPFGLPDLVKPEGWSGPCHEGNTGRVHEAMTHDENLTSQLLDDIDTVNSHITVKE